MQAQVKLSFLPPVLPHPECCSSSWILLLLKLLPAAEWGEGAKKGTVLIRLLVLLSPTTCKQLHPPLPAEQQAWWGGGVGGSCRPAFEHKVRCTQQQDVGPALAQQQYLEPSFLHLAQGSWKWGCARTQAGTPTHRSGTSILPPELEAPLLVSYI